MDLNLLTSPPSPLTNQQAAEWLRRFQRENPVQGYGVHAWSRQLTVCVPPSLPYKASGLVEEMLQWIETNALWDKEGEGFTLSMKGVGVVLSSDQPRKPPEQAWHVAADLIGAAQWINQARAENAPMEVSDILLFGSMADPDREDHGDLDAIILFSSKQEGAYSLAAKELDKLGMGAVLRPDGSSLPSFRIAIRQWLGELMPFISLDDQMRTVEVLLDQDPSFGCYSLLGKSWTLEELAKTTADEEADLIMEALKRGGRNTKRHKYVSQNVRSLKSGQYDLRQSMAVLAHPLEDAKPLHTQWWKNLDRSDLGLKRSVIKVASDTPVENIQSKRTPDV